MGRGDHHSRLLIQLSVKENMSYEAWYDIKPPVQFVHTFACMAHVKVTEKHH